MPTYHLTREPDTRYRVALVADDGVPLVWSRGFKVRSNALALVAALRRVARAWPPADAARALEAQGAVPVGGGARLRRRADGLALELGPDEGAGALDAQSAPAPSLEALLDHLAPLALAARAPLRDYTRVGPPPPRSTRRLRIEFDPEVTDPEAVLALLHALAAVYRRLGGDALVVRDSGRARYRLAEST